MQQLSKSKSYYTTRDHDKNGMYKLTRKTCNRAYRGQTSGVL